MFEAYTEAVRRAFQSGRDEASRFGSDSVEVEHIVPSLLHADLPLALLLFKSEEKLLAVCDRITLETPRNKTPLLSARALLLSRHWERVVSYAAAEAARFSRKTISTEHFLLAILRENTSIAAGILQESGVTIQQLDGVAQQSQIDDFTGYRELVSERRSGQALPLAGRHPELEQIIQILSRRKRSNPVLVGDPGVGKDSVVRRLAQRIADGDVPADLVDRQIVVVEASALRQAIIMPTQPSASSPTTYLQQQLLDVSRQGGPIVYVRGLFDSRESIPGLAAYLKRGKLQMIATSSPLSVRLAMERQDELAHSFEVVAVVPPSEADVVEILAGVKDDLEKFHSVVIQSEAIETAVSASGRFLRHLSLPDRATDLIDDAATRVKLSRQEKTVTADDILEAIATRTSLTVELVRSAIAQAPAPGVYSSIQSELSARIPVGRRDWVNGLVDYLANCSTDDADYLSKTIQEAARRLAVPPPKPEPPNS